MMKIELENSVARPHKVGVKTANVFSESRFCKMLLMKTQRVMKIKGVMKITSVELKICQNSPSKIGI